VPCRQRLEFLHKGKKLCKQNENGKNIEYTVVRIGTPPPPHTQASVIPLLWFRGERPTGLREGVGESQFRRRDRHCGTLVTYVLCGQKDKKTCDPKKFCATTTFQIVCYIYLEGIGPSLVGGILEDCPASGLDVHADLHVGEESGLTRRTLFFPFYCCARQ
jgi:hypothetical protein